MIHTPPELVEETERECGILIVPEDVCHDLRLCFRELMEVGHWEVFLLLRLWNASDEQCLGVLCDALLHADVLPEGLEELIEVLFG